MCIEKAKSSIVYSSVRKIRVGVPAILFECGSGGKTTKNGDSWMSFKTGTMTPTRTLMTELDSYLHASESCQNIGDPLKWRESRSKNFPRLPFLAKEVRCIPDSLDNLFFFLTKKPVVFLFHK